MKKILKRLALIILALFALLLVVGGIMGFMGQNDFNKTRTVQAQQIAIPTDSSSVAASGS